MDHRHHWSHPPAQQGASHPEYSDFSVNSSSSAQLTPTAPDSRKRALLAPDSGLLRTAVACRVCRERKTRCSGHQPTCNYCSKAGLSCEYATATISIPAAPQPSSASLDEWGRRILEAVSQLARGNGRSGNLDDQSRDEQDELPYAFLTDEDVEVADSSRPKKRPRAARALRQGDHIPFPGPSPVSSIPSLLSWKVFAEHADTLEPLSSSYSSPTWVENPPANQLSGRESASCATADLLALAAVFGTHYLPMMPILDMTEIRRYIGNICEAGATWSAESCLVFLVSALASLYCHGGRDSQQSTPTPGLSNPSGSLRSTFVTERFTPGALKYWNMARKRLTWALDGSGVLTAQCQFLAGIWHLYSSELAPAWKMFTGSLLSIDTAISAGQSRQTSNAELLFGQRVRLASLTMLCRLHSEIDVPFAPVSYGINTVNDLESIQSTSGTPEVGSEFDALGSADEDLLRIRQRALATFAPLHLDMSVKEVFSIHRTLTATQRALETWHSKLRLRQSFSRNPTTEDEDRDAGTEEELQCRARLQSSYFETEEMALRPALYMLLHVPWLRTTASAPASQTPGSLQEGVSEYLKAQLRRISQRHRFVVETRIALCRRRAPAYSSLLEAGWLKRHTVITQALMILASTQYIEDEGAVTRLSFLPSSDAAIETARHFFTTDALFPNIAKVYADMLQKLCAR